MLERLMSAALVTAAACAVMFCGSPEPKVEAKPLAAAAPSPKPAAAPLTHCECTGPQNCLCTACKCLACVKPPKAEPVALDVCWACGGDKVLIDEASGKEQPCAACKGTGKVEPVDLSNLIKPTPVSKAAPLYTQPAPVAKPKASPRPVVRYYYVTPRQQGGCSNGSCGSGGRRGLFGRRR
jgi:hypothetical protein